MFASLPSLPTWIVAIVVVVIPTLIAVMAPIVVRHFVPLKRLSANNEVAGFKFATVGVIYAVMLAFVVVVVWEKFNDADNFVSQEAAAAAIIYRISADVPDGTGAAIRQALTDYLTAVIEKDFESMKDGKASPATTVALDHLYDTLLSHRPASVRDTAVFAELLRQLDFLTQQRRARLFAAAGVVPGVLWGVLIVGAVATLTFTLFFGTRNLRAQAMMTGILSILLFSGLLIVVSFDHAFSGSVRVTPHALEIVLRDFGNVSEPNGR